MIIQCPYCNTRFRLAESHLVGPAPMLKCSRCRHIFPAPRTQRAARRRPQPAADPEPELPLAFDDQHWEGPQRQLPLPDTDEAFALGSGAESAARATEDGRERDAGEAVEEFDDDGVDVDLQEVPEVAAGGAPDAEDEEADDDEFEDEGAGGAWPQTRGTLARGEDAMRRRRTSLIPLAVFCAVVVGLYFLLARALISNRDFGDTFVARLPLIGSSMAADRLLFRKIGLSNVTGTYVAIKDAKTVFVISGTASNTASRPLHTIRIEGALLDAEGRELRREDTTCGGMITPRILSDLTQRELELLRKAESPKGYTVPPGESTTFSIVFTDPPPNVAEFAAHVKTARRDT